MGDSNKEYIYGIPRYSEETQMPTIIDESKYFRTAEVLRLVGISRNTLFNWLKRGVLGKYEIRDRHGWRLFTEVDIEILRKNVNHINIVKVRGRNGQPKK